MSSPVEHPPMTALELNRVNYEITPDGLLKTPNGGTFRIKNLVIAGQQQDLSRPLTRDQMAAIENLVGRVFDGMADKSALASPTVERIRIRAMPENKAEVIIKEKDQAEKAPIEVQNVKVQELFNQVLGSFRVPAPSTSASTQPAAPTSPAAPAASTPSPASSPAKKPKEEPETKKPSAAAASPSPAAATSSPSPSPTSSPSKQAKKPSEGSNPLGEIDLSKLPPASPSKASPKSAPSSPMRPKPTPNEVDERKQAISAEIKRLRDHLAKLNQASQQQEYQDTEKKIGEQRTALKKLIEEELEAVKQPLEAEGIDELAKERLKTKKTKLEQELAALAS